MKIIFRLLSAAAAIAALAACNPNKTPEFSDDKAFAAFEATSCSVNENAGVLRIPVTVASVSPKATSVTYSVDKKNAVAKEGTNFQLADQSAVLTFDGKERTKYIEIKIIDNPGVFTGDLSFILNLDNATGIDLGAEKSCKVTIADLDHPLADILGDYNVKCHDFVNGDLEYKLTLSKDPVDTKVVWANALTPFGAASGDSDVYGNVSEDHKTITFPIGQPIKLVTSPDHGEMALYGYFYDGAEHQLIEEGNITFTKQADGTFVSKDGICQANKYIWKGALVQGEKNGFKTVWTKL